MKTFISILLGLSFSLISAASLAMNTASNEPIAQKSQINLASMFNPYQKKQQSRPYWCCRKYVNGRLVSIRKTTQGANIPSLTSQGYQCTTIYNNAPCQ